MGFYFAASSYGFSCFDSVEFVMRSCMILTISKCNKLLTRTLNWNFWLNCFHNFDPSFRTFSFCASSPLDIIQQRANVCCGNFSSSSPRNREKWFLTNFSTSSTNFFQFGISFCVVFCLAALGMTTYGCCLEATFKCVRQVLYGMRNGEALEVYKLKSLSAFPVLSRNWLFGFWPRFGSPLLHSFAFLSKTKCLFDKTRERDVCPLFSFDPVEYPPQSSGDDWIFEPSWMWSKYSNEVMR